MPPRPEQLPRGSRAMTPGTVTISFRRRRPTIAPSRRWWTGAALAPSSGAPTWRTAISTVTAEASFVPRKRPSYWARYRQALWLLTTRDLKVRYTTSALGYLWSIIDPLLMAGIYYFV